MPRQKVEGGRQGPGGGVEHPEGTESYCRRERSSGRLGDGQELAYGSRASRLQSVKMVNFTDMLP